jgi:hypothetical protein
MYLEALITCVNFSDYLAVAMDHNAMIFDHIVVVTSQSDVETIKVATKHGATVVISNRWGDKFAKYKGIDDGLSALHRPKGGWVSFVDADIILPSNLRRSIECLQQKDGVMYGLSRVIVQNNEELKEAKNGVYQGLASLDIVFFKLPGYGYFQLFGAHDPAFSPLDENYLTAAMGDHKFRERFESVLKLDGICIHLGSTLKNWSGRVNPLWNTARRAKVSRHFVSSKTLL